MKFTVELGNVLFPPVVRSRQGRSDVRPLDHFGRIRTDYYRPGRGSGEEDDRCRQNYAPPIHQLSSTSTGARTVRSRSDANSSAGEVPAKPTAAPVISEIARQPRAAFHIALAIIPEISAMARPERCAIT